MTAPRRVLIFVVAYNAERTIQEVLQRIPADLNEHDTEVLVIDDASVDATFERSAGHGAELLFPLTTLFNPVNQGYGGNQKIGFQYAVEQGFDAVALLHGDGQYAPECLPDLLAPVLEGRADAVFGSRMLRRGGARRGGMPLYKLLGNKVLSTLQNRVLGTSLSEFHSGYRVYSVAALRRIPFRLNTNDFHFDTEIIIQLLRAGLRIEEVPIPTYYGDEICHVNGMRYARDVVQATLLAKAQDLGIFYRRGFDVRPEESPYTSKLHCDSSHSMAVARVPAGARVLDVGCSGGWVSQALRAKGCTVTGLDAGPRPEHVELDDYIQLDLDRDPLDLDVGAFDVVLLLDVIEHLLRPEAFVDQLRAACAEHPELTILVSSANVAFAVQRAMLLLGQFNYGKRGLLDMTHTRLFTFASLRRLFEQAGFDVTEVAGVPAPFALALGEGSPLAALAERGSRALIGLAPTLFSYQAFLTVRPRPSLPYLLKQARGASERRLTASAAAARPRADGGVAGLDR